MSELALLLPSHLYGDLNRILASSETDLAALARKKLSPAEMEPLKYEALSLFRQTLAARPPSTPQELALAWNETLADMYSRQRLSARSLEKLAAQQSTLLSSELSSEPSSTAVRPQGLLIGYIRTFLVPMLVTKSFMLYFGLNYAMYPGEGYGWGLLASVSATLGSFAYFVWKNRFETDDRPPDTPSKPTLSRAESNAPPRQY